MMQPIDVRRIRVLEFPKPSRWAPFKAWWPLDSGHFLSFVVGGVMGYVFGLLA